MTTTLLRCLPVVLASAVIMTSCTREPPKARLTVEEYLAHPETMEKTIKDCANNPGELRDDPDCVNAKAAAVRHVPRLRDLPPLGLVPPRESAKNQPPERAAPKN